MKRLLIGCTCLAALAGPALAAEEYSVESINEAAPADALAAEIAARLAPTGFRVLENGNRAIWEFWLAQRWAVESGVDADGVRQYPLQPGELIGVVRLARRGADFRDQSLARGVYTLRYGLQPVDGNHVGTSPTRDFLLLVKAEDDTSATAMDSEALLEASAAAAGSSHPAMMNLQKLDDGAQAPSVRLVAGSEWWALRLSGKAGEPPTPLAIDVVVVGHAAE